MTPAVHGHADARFDKVADALADELSTGAEVGAAIAVDIEGELVVDIWGGHADAAKTVPWGEDTIVNVWSSTKTVTSLAALILADRGLLDLDEPVATYWPEFAANGKEGVLVRHLMGHTAGLSGWAEPMTEADLYDWEKATSLLAAQEPWWKPGTASGYHAITQGYLVGEVIRRITGKTIGTVFREEIAEPLGADFHIGLPASEDARVAELIPPAPGTGAGDGQQTEIQAITFNNPGIDVSATATRAWRGAEIPAAGGTGNARSIAEIHVILANGGVAKGKRFMSEAGCRKALELQIEGTDLMLGRASRFGMGFGLSGGILPLPSPNTIFWGGYGGSLIIIDMDARTTFGYAMNKMAGTTQGDMRAFGLAMAAWTAFGVV